MSRADRRATPRRWPRNIAWMLLGVVALPACATMRRPAILDRAATAVAKAEAGDLVYTRPAFLKAAKTHATEAERAWDAGDVELAELQAHLARQKLGLAAALEQRARDAAAASVPTADPATAANATAETPPPTAGLGVLSTPTKERTAHEEPGAPADARGLAAVDAALHDAEDARSLALALGLHEDPRWAQADDLLAVAQRARDAGHHPRALKKARDAAQIFSFIRFTSPRTQDTKPTQGARGKASDAAEPPPSVERTVAELEAAYALLELQGGSDWCPDEAPLAARYVAAARTARDADQRERAAVFAEEATRWTTACHAAATARADEEHKKLSARARTLRKAGAKDPKKLRMAGQLDAAAAALKAGHWGRGRALSTQATAEPPTLSAPPPRAEDPPLSDAGPPPTAQAAQAPKIKPEEAAPEVQGPDDAETEDPKPGEAKTEDPKPGEAKTEDAGTDRPKSEPAPPTLPEPPQDGAGVVPSAPGLPTPNAPSLAAASTPPVPSTPSTRGGVTVIPVVVPSAPQHGPRGATAPAPTARGVHQAAVSMQTESGGPKEGAPSESSATVRMVAIPAREAPPVPTDDGVRVTVTAPAAPAAEPVARPTSLAEAKAAHRAARTAERSALREVRLARRRLARARRLHTRALVALERAQARAERATRRLAAAELALAQATSTHALATEAPQKLAAQEQAAEAVAAEAKDAYAEARRDRAGMAEARVRYRSAAAAAASARKATTAARRTARRHALGLRRAQRSAKLARSAWDREAARVTRAAAAAETMATRWRAARHDHSNTLLAANAAQQAAVRAAKTYRTMLAKAASPT